MGGGENLLAVPNFLSGIVGIFVHVYMYVTISTVNAVIHDVHVYNKLL